MKPSEALREARNVLMERDWYQGNLIGPNGSVCLVGAVQCAVYGVPSTYEIAEDTFVGSAHISRAAFDAVIVSIGSEDIGDWNDVRGRTIHEVFEALELAEKHAEIQESQCSE